RSHRALIQPVSEPLIVGRIGGPHGIRGWSQLVSLTDPVDNILSYKPLLLEQEAGWQPLQDVEFSRKGNKLLIRLAGSTDRNVAETLRGLQLGLAPGSLPAADPDEFYWRDLIGLTALHPDGRRLGTVASLLDSAAHAVLVIVADATDAAAEEPREVLVPFVEAFTGAIDTAAGTIVVDWPEFDDSTTPDEER
ncbi:MAG: ribosome maturation factor RimM, partial [Pseudomonadota bacterium]